MTTEPANSDSLLKLRVEFWTNRLEHTLTHTEKSSQLLYIVDGAVLALLAFVVDKLRPSGGSEMILVAIPVAFLALLNYYHSLIIMRQRAWYNVIDKRIREILGEPVCRPKQEFESESSLCGIKNAISKSESTLNSTHKIYSRIHKAIAWFLIISSLTIGIHGFIAG